LCNIFIALAAVVVGLVAQARLAPRKAPVFDARRHRPSLDPVSDAATTLEQHQDNRPIRERHRWSDPLTP